MKQKNRNTKNIFFLFKTNKLHKVENNGSIHHCLATAEILYNKRVLKYYIIDSEQQRNLIKTFLNYLHKFFFFFSANLSEKSCFIFFFLFNSRNHPQQNFLFSNSTKLFLRVHTKNLYRLHLSFLKVRNDLYILINERLDNFK